VGYNYNDIKTGVERVGQAIERNLEANSERKARALQKSFDGTRGFWFFLHVVFIPFFGASCYAFADTFLKLPALASTVIGIVATVALWKADFSKQHPLIACFLWLVPLGIGMLMVRK
jgi:hypothetical protein